MKSKVFCLQMAALCYNERYGVFETCGNISGQNNTGGEDFFILPENGWHFP